jgi:hypothetical protein
MALMIASRRRVAGIMESDPDLRDPEHAAAARRLAFEGQRWNHDKESNR